MSLIACATCQVNMAQGGGDAAGWSIFFLLVVILAVLGGVVFLLARLIRRGNAELDPELCDDYVAPSTQS
ncbi:hypothetical protein [Luteolibacter sp. LG18]|uniref:hypothetical protein n=1 Tax=Luteolibacter sp. LG18 TaxID=2819286 RepID=UPI002B314B97|nr:hypothetical protein llg_04990 [Luteolibacter sp. LG18]